MISLKSILDCWVDFRRMKINEGAGVERKHQNTLIIDTQKVNKEGNRSAVEA